jgi:hypothetical protein
MLKTLTIDTFQHLNLTPQAATPNLRGTRSRYQASSLISIAPKQCWLARATTLSAKPWPAITPWFNQIHLHCPCCCILGIYRTNNLQFKELLGDSNLTIRPAVCAVMDLYEARSFQISSLDHCAQKAWSSHPLLSILGKVSLYTTINFCLRIAVIPHFVFCIYLADNCI